MDTDIGWEGNRLVVRRTGDPRQYEKSGPIASEKEIGTSGCTEK